MGKKMIIIGAGVAGLCTGCYAQMNGYDTIIFEMHNIPGGLCTSWQRKGYTFDGSAHWFLGSKPGSVTNRLWREVGALQDTGIYNPDEFYRFEGIDGRTMVCYTDADRLERHLLELSPADGAAIKELVRDVKKLSRLEMPVDKSPQLFGLTDMAGMMVKMGPYLGLMKKYQGILMRDWVKRFKDPLLQAGFTQIISGEFAAFSLVMSLASMHGQDSGNVIGGSLEFAKTIARQYLRLGGKIHYNSRVTEIIVRDGRAVGVKLADGIEEDADLVVSSTDGYATLFGILQGKYLSDRQREYYTDRARYPTFTSVQVSLGVDYDLAAEPHWLSLQLEQPVRLGGKVQEYISFKHYGYDRTLSPAGKSVAINVMHVDYDYWTGLGYGSDAYQAEKQKIADLVVAQFERRFPAARGKVEVVDVATPLTYTRYTGAWRGAYMSWIPTPETSNFRVANTLPGLKGFYLVGQWLMPPGGLPTGVITARWLVQQLCRQAKKPFRVG